jgi:hypothetical protein
LILAPSNFRAVVTGVCGNGVKEGKEQCDCGSPQDCRDKCCDAKTCRLKSGSKCSDGNDSCCKNCQILGKGNICYKGSNFCDHDLQCDGKSVSCANNPFREDGTVCPLRNGLKAKCASGECTSRDLQCVTGVGKKVNSGVSFLKTTSACPLYLYSCQMNCQDKSGNCYQLSGYFVDGTGCAGNGKCYNGKCKSWSLCNTTN